MIVVSSHFRVVSMKGSQMLSRAVMYVCVYVYVVMGMLVWMPCVYFTRPIHTHAHTKRIHTHTHQYVGPAYSYTDIPLYLVNLPAPSSPTHTNSLGGRPLHHCLAR